MMRALIVGCLGACLGSIVLVTPTSAQMHEDTRVGFKFKPPKNFEAVAVGPLEVTTVAKYQSDKKSTNASSRYQYNVLTVHFFPSRDLREDQTREEYFDELVAQWEEGLGLCEVLKEKEHKIDKRPALERHLSPEDAYFDFYQLFLDQEDGVFLFTGTAFKERFKKEVKDFHGAAKSFKRIEKDDSEEGRSEKDQMSARDRFLQEQIDKLPKGWDWMKSDRFLLLYNADKDFVQDASKMVEGLYDAMEQQLPPEKSDDAMLLLRVCNDDKTYGAYGGGQRTGWNLLTRELVTYQSTPPEWAMTMLRYSAYQQYAFYRDGFLSPHPWYRVGYSNYFAGAEFSRSGKVKGFGDHSSPFELGPRLSQGKRAYEKGDPEGFAPLREFLGLESEAFFENFWTHNAQSWAFMHMLCEKKLPQKEWKSLLADYLDNIKAARLEIARTEMEEAVANWKRNLEFASDAEREQELQNEPSDDPESYFSDVDGEAVRRLAYQETFGSWSDDDWKEFEEYFLRYVDSL